VLVHTVVRRDLIEQIGCPGSPMCSTTTRRCPTRRRRRPGDGVGTLVLTHLVPRPRREPSRNGSTRPTAHFKGEVVLATDLLTLDLSA
jgi:hypothetical protein